MNESTDMGYLLGFSEGYEPILMTRPLFIMKYHEYKYLENTTVKDCNELDFMY